MSSTSHTNITTNTPRNINKPTTAPPKPPVTRLSGSFEISAPKESKNVLNPCPDTDTMPSLIPTMVSTPNLNTIGTNIITG